MKVWGCGKWEDISIGQRVFAGACASGRATVGEYATLTGATEKNLVFRTDSGYMIKTAGDNLNSVLGTARERGIFISLCTEQEFVNYKF